MKKIFFVIAWLLLSSIALAGIPNQITVQGKLTDANDVPVTSVSANFNFTIYDDLTTGTLVWFDYQNNVPLNKGLFNTALNPPSNVLFDKPYYLETWVNGNKLTPRVNITSAGYAFSAGRLFAIGNSNMSGYNITNVGYLCLGTDCRSTWPTDGGGAGWYVSGNYVYNDTAGTKVGIGTATPSHELNVKGSLNVTSATFLMGQTNIYGNLLMNGNNILNANNASASMFVDRDNTGYYCDPAGTSNLNSLNVSSFSCTGCVDINTETSGTLSLSRGGTGADLSAASNLPIKKSGTSLTAADIILGTETSGNYLGNVTAGLGISITGTVAEGWVPTITNTGDLSSTNEIQNIITNKGLQRDASNDFGIINCADGQIVKYNAAGQWVCAADQAGGAGWSVSGNNVYNDTAGTKVGIGTATPSHALNVVGGLNVTSGSFLSTLDLRGNLIMNGYSVINANDINASRLVDRDNTAYYCDPAGTSNFNEISCSSCIALGSETSGNYVSGLTAGSGINVTGAAGEGWSPTVAVGYPTKSCPSGAMTSFDLSSSGAPTCIAVGGGGNGWSVSGNNVYNDTAGTKVGIGTATPTHKLNVVGTANITGASYLSTTYLYGNLLMNGYNVMNAKNITATDYVGIGTTSPLTNLHVAGTSGLHLRSIAGVAPSEGGRISWFGDGTGWKLYLQARSDAGTLIGANPVMTLVDSGNAGIGTTTPTQKLDVAGNVNISGTLYLPALANAIMTNSSPAIIMTTNANILGGFGGVDWQQPGFMFCGGDYPGTACTKGDVIMDYGDARSGYSPSSHFYIRYKANGALTNRVTVDSSGNVGIGNNVVPAAKLSIAADGVASDTTNYGNAIQITRTPVSGQQISLIRLGQSVWSLGYDYSTSNFAIGFGQATDSNFAGSNIKFLINSNSNVGIGTTDPKERLHVSGSIALAGEFYNNVYYDDATPDWRYLLTSAPGLALRTVGTNRLEFRVFPQGTAGNIPTSSYTAIGFDTSNGNVGIGTTGPQNKLEVSGGGLRVLGTVAEATSGTGTEIGYDGTEGFVQVYDRAGSLGKPLWLNYGIGNTILGGNVGIGTTTITSPAKLQIDGDGSTVYLPRKSTAGDPSGTNGMIYYNSNSQKFRCFENSAWKDCDTTGGGGGPWAVNGNYIYNTTTAGVGIGTTSPGALLNVKRGTNADSTGQPAGTFAAIVYNAINSNGENGLLVKNNWRASTSTPFEVGGDFVGGAYQSFLKVDGLGNVGIGMTSPLTNLHVAGTSGLHLRSIAGVAPSEGGRISWFGDGTGWKLYLQARNDLGTLQGNPVMTLVDSGNVGIGTPSPSSKLDAIAPGAGGTGLYLRSGGGNAPAGNWYAQISDGTNEGFGGLKINTGWVNPSNYAEYPPLNVMVRGSTALFVNTAGNVGIGTTTPTQKLDVNGNLNVTGDINNAYGRVPSCKEYTTSGTASVDITRCQNHNCHITLTSYCTVIAIPGFNNIELVFGDFWQHIEAAPAAWRIMYIGELASVKSVINDGNGDATSAQMMYTFPSSCSGSYCEIRDDYSGVETDVNHVTLINHYASGDTNNCVLSVCSEGV